MFKDIIGQTEAIAGIKQAIDNNRLPHALLITGNESAGGLALAFAAAQYLMCPERKNENLFGDEVEKTDACGVCAECIQISKLQHPDLHFVYPVIKKDKDVVSKDFLAQWREAFLSNQYLTPNDWTKEIADENKQALIYVSEANNIVRELSIKPYESEYRVMIIWQPEKMREDAANKLLKIIEEPYDKTHFFLVSYDPDRIIGTILSRVQRINLLQIKDEFSQSFSNEEREYFREKFIAMMRLSYAKKLIEMKEWSEEMAGLGRERAKIFLRYSQQMLRENFIMNFNIPELNYMNNDEQQFSCRFHHFIHENNVEGIMNELGKAEKDIIQNVNAKMVFFDLSLKLFLFLKSNRN